MDFRERLENGVAGEQNRGSPESMFRFLWSGIVRDRLPTRFIRKDTHREIKAVRGSLLARDVVLCSDGGRKGPIALAAREMEVAHRAVNLNKGIRVIAGVYHIQNANAFHSRLKE